MYIQFVRKNISVTFFLLPDVPERVSELLVTLVAKRSVTLEWKYQSNGSTPRTDVLIETFKDNIKLMSLIETPGLTNLTITDLSPNTIYSVTIYALNMHGRSAASTIDVSTLNGKKYICKYIASPFINNTETFTFIYLCCDNGSILVYT